jgi:pathogenesis-related protein 1
MHTNSGKSFANGMLCLAVGVLLTACGGGSSDSPNSSGGAPTAAAAPSPQQAASAPAAAASAPQTATTELDAFQKETLDAHNTARKAEGKGLADLKWSTQLQADARTLAERCEADHWHPDGQGQNLYATTRPTATPAQAVQTWMGEKPDYTYSATGGTCAANKACGHYTQVIWHATTEVGCAVKTCDALKGFPGGRTIFVCNYSPAGNMGGQPPYPPQ